MRSFEMGLSSLGIAHLQDNRRRNWVLFGMVLLACLSSYFAYERFASEIDSHQKVLQRANKELLAKELELRRAKHLTSKYQLKVKKSLHPDPSKAQVTYQEYLVRLTDKCGLSSVVITGAQPERLEGLGHILHFSVQGTGTTNQFGRLIETFYQTEAFHRITHLNIFQSLGPDSPTHSLSIEIALLTFESAEAKPDSQAMELPEVAEHVKLFASRDIFRRPAEKTLVTHTLPSLEQGLGIVGSLLNPLRAPVEDQEKPEPTTIMLEEPAAANPTSNIRFVGVIANDQLKSALFLDTSSGKQHALNEEESLIKLGISSRILSIRKNAILVEDAHGQIEIPLGALYSEGNRAN